MAVVLGNLPFLPDTASCRTLIIERRIRPLPLPFDVALNLPKRDAPPGVSNSNNYSSFFSKGLEFDGESRSSRAGVRGKVNSKVNEVEFDSNSSDEENGNGEEEEPGFDWKAMMRKRVKELESEKELEKKAEELQGRLDEESKELGIEETEEEKRMRVKKELEKLAKEQAERRETAQLMFDLGQKAYGRGMYGRAIEFLEAALTIIPGPTLFGGEIQIWLAMAYEANNRHDDCIELYQQLERKHPSVSIRRQAAELRYIMQAPKIKITQEEMVSIPLIGSPYDKKMTLPSTNSEHTSCVPNLNSRAHKGVVYTLGYAGTWSDKYKDMDQPVIGSTTNQLASSRDYLGDVLKWKPPVGLEKNQAFWVTVVLWLGLVGAALFLQR